MFERNNGKGSAIMALSARNKFKKTEETSTTDGLNTQILLDIYKELKQIRLLQATKPAGTVAKTARTMKPVKKASRTKTKEAPKVVSAAVVKKTLKETGGNLTKAAKLLQIPRRDLYKFGVKSGRGYKVSGK